MNKRDREQLVRSLGHMMDRNMDMAKSLRSLAERVDESTLMIQKLLEILQKGK